MTSKTPSHKAALWYLKELKFSVIPFKIVYVPGEEKPDKIPLVSWTDYQLRLPTEDEVNHWWTLWPDACVGIVTGQISGLVAMDTDDAEADEYFNSLIPDGLICPTVETISGGKHYWFFSKDIKLRSTSGINGYKLDVRANGGFIAAPPSKNGGAKGYSFLKGLHVHNIEIPQLPETLYNILIKNKHIYKEHDLCQEKMFMQGRRDQDIFHVAHVMLKGGSTKDEARQVLEILAKNCEPPFSQKEMEAKIQSALSRKVRSESGLTEEIKRVIESQDGVFSVSECVNQWQEGQSESSVSNSVRGQIRKALSRLCSEGVIQRVGSKSGHYRRVETDCPDMDLNVDPGEGHPIELPFNLRKWVKIYPKNIIIVGGSKSSGKTAFLMNTAYINKDFKEGVYYYNSEGGPEEVRGRLDLFPYPYKDWKKVHFKERNYAFADVIRQNPNAIHIIDFLEIHTDFFEVGGLIREMYDAVDKGVLVIGIQKPKGRDLPIGNERAAEKARLILALDYGRIKIYDAKNFATKGVNPRGWTLHYKIVDGCKYFVEPDATTGEDWREEDETNRPPRT